ncbi:MAG: rhomboid family intramembrane serine protease [Nitrososphaerales archaeon]|jgi:rhomboid protease GluP
MGYLPRGQSLTSSITFVLLIVNVAVFVTTLVGGDQVLLILAQTGDLFFAGFYWQPFTAMFVHFDVLHILFNMFALVYFGTVVEGSYSRAQYISVYFAAGLLGNLASLFLIPLDAPTGGASGAIFGLLGAYVAMERKGPGLVIAVLYAGLIFIDSSGPGVNIFAHLFGILTGFGLGLFFAARNRSRER